MPTASLMRFEGISLTKLTMPSAKSQFVERPRLEEINKLLQNQLVMMSSPGGYGKTHTMACWAQTLKSEGIAAAWLSIDENDVEPDRLLRHLAAAFVNLGGRLPEQTATAMLQGHSEATVRADDLLNAFVDHAEKCVFFLDDLHYLLPRGAVYETINEIIRTLPNNVHLVFSSRERPTVLIAQNKHRMSIREYSSEDLKLTRDELVDYLSLSGFNRFTKQQIDGLLEASEGWIAGVKLAIANAQGNKERLIALMKANPSNIKEFFAYDILARQSEETQKFLLSTSVLKRFNADLASSVTQTQGSAQQIADLQTAGLFIFSIGADEEWFRYHHLFSDFLLKTLRANHPEWEKELHQKAAAWHAHHGSIEDAFAHFLQGGDIHQAGKILDDRCADLLYEGHSSPLLNMSDKLPDHVMREFPRLLLIKAWTLALKWRSSEAARLIHVAEEAIEKQRAADDLTEEALTELVQMLLTVKMVASRFDDQLHQTRSFCTKLLTFAQLSDTTALAIVHDTLIHVETDQFDFTKVEYRAREVQQWLASHDDDYVIIWHKASLGRAHLLQGNTKQAIEACEKGIAAAMALGFNVKTYASNPALVLAEVHYQTGNLRDAKALCQTYWNTAQEAGFPEKLISALLIRARILEHEGKTDEAIRLLEEGLRQGEARHFARFTLVMACELLTFALRHNDTVRARELYSRHGVGEELASCASTKEIDRVREVQAAIWVRFALFEGRLREAKRAATQWRDLSQKAGAKLSFVQWSILVVRARLLEGDHRGAVREIRSALRTGEQGELVQAFLDDLTDLSPVLRQIADAGGALEGGSFASKLLRLSGETWSSDAETGMEDKEDEDFEAISALGAKEIEIIKCLDAGLTNREIGDAMGMTEGTVKWYLQRVYDAFGVRRRVLAIEKAKRLKLLA